MSSQLSATMNDELIRTAFERSPSGMLAVDSSGRIVLVNAEVERIFGWSRAELLGQRVEVLVPEHLGARHTEHRKHYDAEPSSRRMGAGRELAGRRRDGSEVPIEIGLSVVETSSGRLVLSTIVDVTQRRLLEERLRQKHKLEAVGSLASGVAHDFNNILLGILGYAELVRETLGETHAVAPDLDVIIDAGRRGRDLIKRILTFARPTQTKRIPIDVSEVIANTLQLQRPMLPPGIEIRHVREHETPTVLADPVDMQQILLNLVSNGLYAMSRSGGVLVVCTRTLNLAPNQIASCPDLRPGMYVHIEVSDTGSGIPEDQLANIFAPFYTTKPAGEGTGLGLSVVARIVRALGGGIEVSSVVGKGTRFGVYLPASLRPADVVEPRGSAQPGMRRIMLVEDETTLACLGQRILQHCNYDVVAFTSSLSALEAFRENPRQFSLVITDNTMPHMTGLELVGHIREIRPDVPILMVSGVGESMSNEQLRQRGVTRLLPKPYRVEDLRAAVKALAEP